MSASLDLETYENFWKERVFANGDKQYVLRFKTKKEAERMRFRGYGFIRAIRAWVADPMTADVFKREHLAILTNIRMKELVVQYTGTEYALVIRPRVQMVVEEQLEEHDVNLEQLLPTVRARIEDARDVQAAEMEYQQRVAAGEIKPALSPQEEQDRILREAMEHMVKS